MPNLLVFAACERVIVESETHNLSLISIFHDLNVDIRSDEVPPDAMVPMRWQIVTLWSRDAVESERGYEEICDLHGPDGSVIPVGRVKFSMGESLQRNITTVFGFPGRPGTYAVKLSLRSEPDGPERNIAALPISMRFRSA